MRKQAWSIVFNHHRTYMVSLVKSLVNDYKGVFDEDGVNSTTQNEGFRLLANLLDEDELLSIAPEAFRKAYEVWDGKRPFKPLFRLVFINMVKNLARVERRHRLREVVNSEVEGLRETPLEARDMRSYLIPCELVDLVDFLNSFTPIQRVLVDAVLNARDALDLTKDFRPIAVLGALRRFAKSKGITDREYTKVLTEIGFKLKERTEDATTEAWKTDPRCGLAY